MDQENIDNVKKEKETSKVIPIRNPLHYQDITPFHLEQANIPKRLFTVGPHVLLDSDKEYMNRYLNIWSDNTHKAPANGLMFYHNQEFSVLPEFYMAFLLVGAMIRRRNAYCISMTELQALDYEDPEFVRFLISRHVLGIYNFPMKDCSEKTIRVLNRIICGRYDKSLPTLFASSSPQFHLWQKQILSQLIDGAITALALFSCAFAIGEKHES